MEFMSVKETSAKFGLSERRIQKLCEEGRISGSQMISNVWIIPSNAQKPSDERYTTPPCGRGLVSIKELSLNLSISEATGRNWLKLGKIIPTEYYKGKPMFSTNYVETLKSDISSGKNASLKSRRNKKYISGSSLYRDYVSENSRNIAVVEKVLSIIVKNGISLEDREMRLITAECALQFMNQKYNHFIQKRSGLLYEFLCGNCFVPNYNQLILDLVGTDLDYIDFIKSTPELFNIEYIYEEAEDILGLLYISCRNLSSRKATGTYYTPTKIVKRLIDSILTPDKEITGKSVIDPCCGTGNFLLQLPKEFLINDIYGTDIDEISILLTRINVALKFSNCNIDTLYSNITLKDYFDYEKSYFDFVIGNPPWGFDYSDNEKKNFKKKYRTAKGKVVESYDLFLERSLMKLNSYGEIAFVLPEAILNVKVHQTIREEIISEGKIKSIQYLGNVFDGVQCPCIILQIAKCPDGFSTKGMQIVRQDEDFIISSERVITPECFSFTIKDEEYNIFKKLERKPNYVYLKGNAEFALGIVTGDNKRYISSTPSPNSELVLKGAEIYKYKMKPVGNYLEFVPDNFQQVAPVGLYRAPEKLLYRFICNQLVFAYDNAQTLSLNSCNIVIPKIDGIDIRYIMAILNSRVAQFIFSKQFQSVKVLRSHIEQIPIPVIDKEQQQSIITEIDTIARENESQLILHKYNVLDRKIASLFSLDDSDYATIKKALGNCNLFLY